jgi:hypothetical protein
MLWALQLQSNVRTAAVLVLAHLGVFYDTFVSGGSVSASFDDLLSKHSGLCIVVV